MGFLAALLPFLGPLGDFIIKLIKSLGPSPIQVESEKAGAAEAQAADAKQAVKAETAVAQAEADAPTSLAGVKDDLAKGDF